MGSQYAKYRRPDGDEAVLMSDPLSRGKYERKGFTYLGPSDWTPGLENANPEKTWDVGGDENHVQLDPESVIRQALDVVSRKITGTWTEAEAVTESQSLRNLMAERGSFPTTAMDLPQETSAQATTGPFPTPVTVPPGAVASVTNPVEPAPLPSTDGSTGSGGAADLSTVPSGSTSGSTGSTTGTGSQTVAHAGSPGTFEGTTPTLKGELDQARAEPSTAWGPDQYVRVNSRDYTWNGSAWVTATTSATEPMPAPSP